MTLGTMLRFIQERQVARVTFLDECWYIVKRFGFIRYCDMNGENVGETIKLTPSNLGGSYELIE